MIRLLGYFFAIGAVFFLVVAGGFAWYIEKMGSDLPDYQVLAAYEPPVTTRVHAADGSLMAEYARQRRLFLPIQAVPDLVKNAFLSAEDKNFYQHPGVDIEGVARAVMVLAKGGRMQGASTITQQVAKNFLLTNERTFDRKIKEAILSLRIEQAYSKDKILELYLNEIYLGLGSYGVAAAALAYFDKSVNELTIEEAAYLGALPKAPENYNPFRDPDRAIERRNWVIDQMAANGFITAEAASEAQEKPLDVNPRPTGTYLASSEYFTEDVRREIIQRYGVDALYEGGLSVRTTLDPTLQAEARKALQHGLIKYDEERGWRGPVTRVEIGSDWGQSLAKIEPLADVPEWRLAVVLTAEAGRVEIGLQPPRDMSGARGAERELASIARDDMKWALRLNTEDRKGNVSSAAEVLSRGDVVYVEKKEEGAGYRLRQPPKVQGALVAMEPKTGRVVAMVGGFSFAQSEFNRASQAYRQPGSSFKPFVYAAALDNGYTPSSVIMDAPISLPDGNGGVWEPSNYGGGSAGPSTLRLGIEKSRNLMTIRLAKDMGMDLVAEYAERFGIYDNLGKYLPMALGAGETTVLRMVSAYSVIANGGRSLEPSLIDRVQDRYGKTIYKHDQRICQTCDAPAYDGQSEPELVDERDQVLDPMTAYQITSMMEGVVQRGTATRVAALGVPIAGKTGTTNEEKDVWFVGFTPDLVTGVFLGYDNPTPMGRGATGGGMAAPVFIDFMEDALEGVPPVEFKVPEGMDLIAVNRKTGMRSGGSGGDVIMEAFKPGTGPSDTFNIIGADEMAGGFGSGQVSQEAEQAIVQGGGGGGLF
ncbi:MULTISPECIES: penicillin-binding protein 1A [Aurantimonas]|uniref:penicillin-binding protein 1A n=1 Tax=Aurantimonas TaxID=182269 RepID=UPI0004063EB6|nr:MULTISPECIES: penicillin-binding protein 1A [Aurantimonas]MBC6714905.1 penicillin-binding protein 1A [Aurantimonas sp. DM33-3]MCW7545364.1 penicillin-binding protein 1A [Aurantimonas litoralis]